MRSVALLTAWVVAAACLTISACGAPGEKHEHIGPAELYSGGASFTKITNVNSGLEIYGGGHSAVNATQVLATTPYDDDWSRMFSFVPKGGNQYQLSTREAGLCIDAPSALDGSPAQLTFCAGGTTTQRWLLNLSTPTQSMVNFSSGLCLDVSGGSTTAGAGLVMRQCSAATSQQWKLTSVVSANAFTLACQGDVGCNSPNIPGTAFAAVGGVPGVTGDGWGCSQPPFDIDGPWYGLLDTQWGIVDRSGIVGGGHQDDADSFGCDPAGDATNKCLEGHLSQTDLARTHDDRDYNLEIIPTTDWTRNTLDRSLLAQDNLAGGGDHTPGSIAAEVEWLYVTPTVPSIIYSPINEDLPLPNGMDLGTNEAAYSASGGEPDGTFVDIGIPYRGNEISIRGRSVKDCGHQSSDLNGYEGANNGEACSTDSDCANDPNAVAQGYTACLPVNGPTIFPSTKLPPYYCTHPVLTSEIHPPEEFVWLRPRQGTRDATIYIRALTHETNPIGRSTPSDSVAHPNTGLFASRFHMPGGQSPTDENLYVGPLLTDWVVNPYTTTILGLGGSGWTSGDPYGMWFTGGRQAVASDMAQFKMTDLFIVSTYAQGNGSVEIDTTLRTDNGGVIPGTNYRFDAIGQISPFTAGAHLRVCYPDCQNGVKMNSCPLACKPGPANLVANLGTSPNYNNQPVVTLAWSPVTGASGGYHVYRATAANAFPSGYVQLPPCTSCGATAYVDTVQSGTTYYYVVTAMNAETQEGAPSNVAGVTTPIAPVASIHEVGTQHVTLSWTSVPNAIGYQLYRGGVVSPLTSGSQVFSYVDSTANPTCGGACPYRYWVVGQMPGGGASAASAVVTAQPLPMPLLNGSPSISAPPTGILLSWDVGVPQSNYTVIGPYPLFWKVSTNNLDAFAIPGTAGVMSCFTIQATAPPGQDANPSMQSDTTSPICITPQLPPAPTGLVATAGVNSVTVTWTAIPGAYYQVWMNGSLLGTGNAPNVTKTGLTTGVTYSFQIAAFDAYGTGPLSSAVSATPPCNGSSCSTGCCSGNSCLAGNQASTGCISGGLACAAACTPGFTCSGGACACVRIPQATACAGLHCGTADNGCGGTYSCGTCGSFSCGRCEPGVCSNPKVPCP